MRGFPLFRGPLLRGSSVFCYLALRYLPRILDRLGISRQRVNPRWKHPAGSWIPILVPVDLKMNTFSDYTVCRRTFYPQDSPFPSCSLWSILPGSKNNQLFCIFTWIFFATFFKKTIPYLLPFLRIHLSFDRWYTIQADLPLSRQVCI